MTQWVTVVLPIWILCGALILGQWFYLRRKYRPAKPPDPDIVLAGRKLYEDGEFRREIVRRIPRGLFDDQVKLSCGHQSSMTRKDSSTHTDCYRCAEEWMEDEAKRGERATK